MSFLPIAVGNRIRHICEGQEVAAEPELFIPQAYD